MSTRLGEYALQARIKVSFWWRGDFVLARIKYFCGQSPHHFSGLANVSQKPEISV